MLKSTINYKHLLAELLIISVGVAIALAADSWREDIALQSERNDYLQRISDDLEIGFIQLSNHSRRNSESLDSALKLIGLLSSEEYDDDQLIHHFAYASQTGATSADFTHDTTYRDLISTGRLSLIEATDIRLNLDRYYSLITDIISIRSGFSSILLGSYTGLVGKIPENYTNAQNEHSSEEISRIQMYLKESPDIQRNLRRQSSLQQLLVNRFTQVIELNRALIDEINEQ